MKDKNDSKTLELNLFGEEVDPEEIKKIKEAFTEAASYEKGSKCIYTKDMSYIRLTPGNCADVVSFLTKVPKHQVSVVKVFSGTGTFKGILIKDSSKAEIFIESFDYVVDNGDEYETLSPDKFFSKFKPIDSN
jgi:hypothetical protein